MSKKNIRFEIIEDKRTKLQKILYYSLKVLVYGGLITFLIYLIILLHPFVFLIGGAY